MQMSAAKIKNILWRNFVSKVNEGDNFSFDRSGFANKIVME
jgi:hypothetical protein